MKQIGVKGFCSKDRTEDLVRAIEEVLQGETHFTEIQD
jgi:DNA-binding NarL/FixJ family response regulator